MLAYVAALPVMKPAVAYPAVLADLLFVVLLLCLAAEIVLGGRRIGWVPAFGVLAAFVLSLAPSMLATPDLGQSAFKLVTEVYLAGLAVATIVLVRDESRLRRMVLVWLVATALLVGLAIASLIAFQVAPLGALYGYSRFHFGTLPPGEYPRLALTFFNANMACNYLTVSVGMLFLAVQRGWISNRTAWPLLAGILVAAAATISPGLGGIALALGTGLWLTRRWRLALFTGIAVALAFLVFQAFTPIVHSTAPFTFMVPGTGQVVAPSGRFLTWSAALAEWASHPILGHGIGIDAVHVAYADPSGNLQQLTDAHNVVLSIAAQAGLVGLAGLILLLGYAVRLTFAPGQKSGFATIQLGLGLTFLNAFLYQGLGGSFEDTRHLWVLFGLLVAAARLPVTRSDENNRRAGAPSPC